ncbi:hypothetical protein LguiB_005119 [Lonicera macranthoides]
MYRCLILVVVVLNLGLVSDEEVPKIPIFQGPNIVGRNSIPRIDKRLSRKHLTIIGGSSLDGFVNVLVEGTNPVVIRSQDQRKKLFLGENLKIRNGDVIEFIPGHHLFKYVAVGGEKKTPSLNKQKRTYNSEGSNNKFSEGELLSRKRIQQVSQDEAFARNLQVELNNGPVHKTSSEAIRQFNPPNDKLPLTFRLMRVQGLPGWANTNAVTIRDVIQGDVLIAVLSNYMVDMDWLNSACPTLKKVPHVLVIHGESDDKLEYMERSKPANWIMHKPPLPISYGTHHSKAMLLVYPHGVRVIVHTANLIHVDWNNKSQGLWMQDFPWKDQSGSSKVSGFESDLIDYLSALKLLEFNASLPGRGNFKINASFFKKFDYSSATVRLIASVPGYHSGANLKKWGHMKLRSVLQECIFDKEFKKSPLIYQFSSLGSLDEKWMSEFAFSMSSGVSEDRMPLGLGEPLIIWPTVEDVRCSLEGYAAGSCIPSPQKNVEREFLKKYWAKWKANHTGRSRAMPHIKTFTRYNGQNLAWFLLTSANLSKAAWGALQKKNSQLMIRSYELGVLFLPSKQHSYNFSCTNNVKPSGDKSGSTNNSLGGKRTELVTLAWQGKRNADTNEVIQLPLPYELPPKRYTSEDVPWCWDRNYVEEDVYGQVWPR